jgi:putative phosphoribosyl transferase
MVRQAFGRGARGLIMSIEQLPFRDRHAAGRVLAELLGDYKGRDDVLVLALPRGGVPVGYEIAHALVAPLDVFVVRKLGYPGHEEYAMGAIASGGVQVFNPEAVDGFSELQLKSIVARERAELARREALYRGAKPPLDVHGRTVIVVDDGLATGATMRAAVAALRQHEPARLVVAVPVGAEDTCRQLQAEADEVVCAATPYPFRAVGLWYREFAQTSDEEVRQLLDEAQREHALAGH